MQMALILSSRIIYTYIKEFISTLKTFEVAYIIRKKRKELYNNI